MEEPKLPLVLPHEYDMWPEIQAVLATTKATNSHELQTLLTTVSSFVSNDQERWGFFSNYGHEDEVVWESVIPFVQKLVLKLPTLFPDPIYHLTQHNRGEVILTREQVGCLMACSFFGLFACPTPEKGDPYSRYRWPHFHLPYLFPYPAGSSAEFCKCIMHYFRRLSVEIPEGNVVYTRVHVDEMPEYSTSAKKLRDVTITPQYIEVQRNVPFHADFANKYIGGGVLTGGCVQEEILFVIKPECLVSLLICSVMKDNESIIISGAEQFSAYKGYGHHFMWAGDFMDTETPKYEKLSCLDNHIIAVDAIMAPHVQFEPSIMQRDINKLFSALNNLPDHSSRIYATGNWGCGAFGGNKQLKAIQQIISASEAEVDLTYCCFNDHQFQEAFEKFCEFLKSNEEIQVSHLFNALMQFHPKGYSPDVFNSIRQTIQRTLDPVVADTVDEVVALKVQAEPQFTEAEGKKETQGKSELKDEVPSEGL